MNITITINDDKEIIVQPEKENQIKQITTGKTIVIYKYELANHLLSKGFSIKKIKPNTITNEGLIFLFYSEKGIRKEINRWNWESKKQEQKEEIITEEGDKI